ncbi:uncharacterized protein LOC143226890 [Tachypleus tridentatus]|uniref:uncharacterized protein LOC143226890 n=1 Tax=Tachypleus tridentatus TaxID=6853 RepID=UPI003FCF985E
METLLFSVLLVLGSQQLVQSISRDELYPYGNQDDLLPQADDVSSLEVQITVPIVFYEIVYRSIFVNDNGILSFLTEVPSFYNGQLPRSYPIISPLYTDVDIRGTGRVYYRETKSQRLLTRANNDIQRHFSQGRDFQATSLFIATWDNVGHFDQKTSLVNTFQVVIATDGVDSFVFFLFPEGGVQWIQGDGKSSGRPDPRAQSGFMSGDGRLYTLRGSGTDQTKNFDRMSNVYKSGVWMFHVGKTGQDGNVIPADQGLEPPILSAQTCANAIIPCPPTSNCIDYKQGFCCECGEDYFGNGINCFKKGIDQRMNGKLKGTLNNFKFDDVDIHTYVVTSDGRTYTAVSKIPLEVGYDMQALFTIGEIVGWLFAVPHSGAKNGFMVTGGAFNRTVEIEFPQTGHHVTIDDHFLGPDVYNQMQVVTQIRGSLPTVPIGSKIILNEYEEEFTRISNGLIRSHSSRTYRLQDNGLEVPFQVDQTISFLECKFGSNDPDLDSMKLKHGRTFIVYNEKEEILRYAMTSKISPRSVKAPCRQGSSQCGPNSKCVEEGDNFRCVCEQGYEYLYEDDVNGEKATCLDINECTSGRDNCHLYAECINLPGSFACRCLRGYSGNGVNCERTLTCNDLNCDVNAECDLGPNDIPVCRCKAGFEGDGYVCQHVSGIGEDCRIVNYCDSHASCNFNPTAQKFQCECNPGYTGDGVVCIEEISPSTCDVANNCDKNALCVHQYGGYVCECKSGFSGDGYKCVPETPAPVSCNIENICHPQALCVYDSSADEYKCRCNAGYVGDGYQCTQSQELTCDVNNICSIHADCVYDSFVLKHVCQCQEGYDGDGINCEPIDECNTVENCDRNAQCTYDSSSNRYRCMCNPGYLGDGKSCQLEEDVGCNIVNNCDVNAECVYDYLSLQYHCQCRSGFQGDGKICRQVEIPCNVVNRCDVRADCLYDPGSQGYRCRCWEGYEGDGFTCHPGTSCREKPDVCDVHAECVYSPDSDRYYCRCASGYTGDGFTCEATPKFEGQYLLFTQGMSLLQMPFNPTRNNPGKLVLMEPYQTAIGIATDCQKGHVYWTDVAHRVIRRANYDGSSSEVFIRKNLLSPEGVAIDWASRNIYWTDSVKDTIEVANLDGREHMVLIGEDLVNPRGIAVHPGIGRIFWTDWNRESPKIETANMDGTERSILIGSNLKLPNMLAVDYERSEICWTDSGLARIECAGFSGENRRVVYTPAAYPFGITIINGNIYWTDWEIHFIQRVNRNGGDAEPLELPLGGNGKLYGITSVPSQCPRVTTLCGSHNGGCQYLCLPNGTGQRTCACPEVDEDSDDVIDCNQVI